jgi:hypothetical protein
MSTGVRVSEAQATSFKVGISTYDQVVADLGPPTTSTLNSDGTRIASYSYAAYQARPENFIPYIGGLVGGMDSASSVVEFKFDRNGVLLGTSSSQSSSGSGQYLAGGTPIQRNSPQQ